MITTDRNFDRTEYDVLVRNGNYPNQGEKLVIQKGTVKISIPYSNVPALLGAIAEIFSDFKDD